MVEAEKLAASACSSDFGCTGKHHVCLSSDFGNRKPISHRMLVGKLVRRSLRLICTEYATGCAQEAVGSFRVWPKNEIEILRFSTISAKAQAVLVCQEAALQPTGRCVQVRTPPKMMTEMDDPMVLESVLAAAPQASGRCVQVRTPSEMRTEMDDPMVLESLLAERAWEKQKAVLKMVVFENSVVDSPASGAMQVTRQVVGMETSPPALTDSLVGDDMSKHGVGAQSESAQEEDLAEPKKSSEVGIASEVPFESSSLSSPNSGNFNDIAGEGTAVAQQKRRIRRKNWGRKDTDDLLEAVLNTSKVISRMEQGTASDSYWDAVAKSVPGRTGDECRGRTDTLKRSFSTTKKYCDEHGKEFKQLSEKDFFEMKVSPRLTEEWYNQIRDYCPPRPKKKLKTNGTGSSSKSSGSVPYTSTLGLQPVVLPDGIDQGEPALVDPPADQLELQVADPLHRQAAPPAPELFDDSIQVLLASFEDWLNTDLAMQDQ